MAEKKVRTGDESLSSFDDRGIILRCGNEAIDTCLEGTFNVYGTLAICSFATLGKRRINQMFNL